jgi:hypothetical protein
MLVTNRRQEHLPHIQQRSITIHRELEQITRIILFQNIYNHFQLTPYKWGGATPYIESSLTSIAIKYDLFLLDPQFAPRENNKIHHSITSSIIFPKISHKWF